MLQGIDAVFLDCSAHSNDVGWFQISGQAVATGYYVATSSTNILYETLHLTIDDFFPRKQWRLMAGSGFILPDPFSGCPGVEKVGDGIYRVTVRAATRNHLGEVAVTLRLAESFEESRLVFSPLLDRFYAGEDYRTRPVKVSDSGRIRNELQTLCSDALEYFGEESMRVHFDRIGEAVMSADKKRFIREVLEWYQRRHPIWFGWLELAE